MPREEGADGGDAFIFLQPAGGDALAESMSFMASIHGQDLERVPRVLGVAL